jgi:hypothetical protein
MRDLSREEELERKIYLLEEASDNKKWERTKRTFFVLSAVVYFTFFMSDRMNGLLDFLAGVIIAPICAGFIMFISCLVLLYMETGSVQENKEINLLKGELNAIRAMKYEKMEQGVRK